MLKIKSKSGAMKPSSYLLMTLAISLIIISSWMVLGEFKVNYPEIETNETWQLVYEQANRSVATVGATTETIRNATARMEAGGFKDIVIGGFVMLTIIPQMGKLILQGMVGTLTTITRTLSEIGVPGIVTGIIIVALTIIILFGVVSAIWKFKEV